MAELHDLVVIGAGPGGYVAALRAARRGLRVALVERDRVGGTCLNRGCIPTKTMVQDAEVFEQAASGTFCVTSESPLLVDFARLMARKNAVVAQFVEGVEQLLSSAGVELIVGDARLAAADTVIVSTAEGPRELRARAIILATGSSPHIPAIEGAHLPGVVTSRELLTIERLPESLVVIGGSTVGVEFACLFNALGTAVTVLGRKSFVQEVEPQLAKRLRSLMARSGISVNIGLDFERIALGQDGRLGVHYARRGKAESATGEIVLLATGRTPVSEGLGLAELGVAMRGSAIAVDEHLQTSLPGIYAIGDCTGGYMLAHVASYEAEVAVANIMGEVRAADYTVVPACVFTIPEIASVGLTEDQAKERGLDYLVTRFPMRVNGRALALGEPEGQVRMICERQADGTGGRPEGGRILGVHILGARASELIAEAALAMRLGATAHDLATTIHAHPTVPEALMEAAMAQGEGAIHYENR